MPGLQVHHLNCAHITAMSIGGQPLACHVLLIETPANGLVLVDSGLGTADYADLASRLGFSFARLYGRPAPDPSLAAVRQVAALGFRPADVRHIVQTHLDLDHVGGLSDFPWATVHVHAAELAAATARKGIKARGRYRPPMWAHHPDFVTYSAEGEPWLGFETVRDLKGMPDQILFVPLPGHTLGHCGVAVQGEYGWLLDAGDAYFDARQVHQPVPQIGLHVGLFERVVTTDKRLRVCNQGRLRRFTAAHPEVTVFAAHDPGGFPDGQP
jgi:glyoxylase-like metal-dependent hydrolase (beta-lactamase superfamily II)